MQITTLLFDLDGTISDPLEGFAKSINHALAGHGYRQRRESELMRYIGPSIVDIFRSITGSNDERIIKSCINRYRDRYARIGYSENDLYKGMEELLIKLTHLKVRMGICTSKRKDFAQKITQLFGISERFEFIDGGDIGISKTDQIAELLATRVIDKSAIMIGDRDVDIAAAKNNSIRSIGVLWGYGSEEELRMSQPDFLVKSPNEIAQIIVKQVG